MNCDKGLETFVLACIAINGSYIGEKYKLNTWRNKQINKQKRLPNRQANKRDEQSK